MRPSRILRTNPQDDAGGARWDSHVAKDAPKNDEVGE
jgi:hypothetical protein